METGTNIISSDAKFYAIAWVMFFSPFIKNKLKYEEFSENEKIFIDGYVKIWLLNITLLFIVLLTTIVNVFETNQIFNWIINICSFAIYIISVFSIFAWVNGLSMRWPDESIHQIIQHKWSILKAYTPIFNFILWYRQENYTTPYRWLKESILLRSFFIFGTLLLWNSFGVWVLIVIAIRIILLMWNIDIIPISIKKAINSLFLCNPWEMFAYIFTPLVVKLKKLDYDTVLQARKQWYAQWQNFWIWIMVQYIIFILMIYLLYYKSIDVSIIQIVLLFAAILWVVRIIVFYINKKTLPKLPILSEITSLVFH